MPYQENTNQLVAIEEDQSQEEDKVEDSPQAKKY